MTQPASQHDPVAERAWSRIGRDEWSQLKWFVKLANTTGFAAMTEGERLLWQEEFLTMLGTTPLSMPVPPDTKRSPSSSETHPATFAAWKEHGMLSTPEAMQAIRDAIAPHLERLADDKGTRMGPFDFTYTVNIFYNPAHKETPDLPRYVIEQGEVATGRAPNPFVRSLSFRMSKLLVTHGFADKLRRCPFCQRLFLQLRRSARYCGQKCYTVAGMRELRERRRKERELRSSKRKGMDKRTGKKIGRESSAKRRSRHGTKKQ